ncbi:unnamed protein product [marine sediment metagenome]|uniref:Uncharacterized protein n=1 Tax=marine sediment metagenome TaxID=412755 RepID=X0RP66_9ZZZZ
MSEYIRRAGIVKGVTAKEYGGEYRHLSVQVSFETQEPTAGWQSGSGEKKVDEFNFTLPIGSPVNPGDVAVVTMEFESPFGQRFKPALEVGVENPADVLDEDMLADELTDYTGPADEVDADA